MSNIGRNKKDLYTEDCGKHTYINMNKFVEIYGGKIINGIYYTDEGLLENQLGEKCWQELNRRLAYGI